MSVYLVVDCDHCGSVEIDGLIGVAVLRKKLEGEGWTFADESLCPYCSRRRELGLEPDPSRLLET